jgi:hypothetical protein
MFYIERWLKCNIWSLICVLVWIKYRGQFIKDIIFNKFEEISHSKTLCMGLAVLQYHTGSDGDMIQYIAFNLVMLDGQMVLEVHKEWQVWQFKRCHFICSTTVLNVC